MNEIQRKKYIYETTIPYLDFGFRKYSNKVTLIGLVFAQELEKVDRFLFFVRTIYQVFEPSKDTVVNGFLDQIDDLYQAKSKSDDDWKKHFEDILSWEKQEKVVSELIFTAITNLYLTYLTDMASFVIDNIHLAIDKRNALRSFPKIKKCFQANLRTPLYQTSDEEKFADQIVTLRNLVVHSLNYIPDQYYPKFHNWKDLGCIKQDSDIFYIEFDYKSLDRLGNFLSKSIADIDHRLSENFNIDTYYFDEEDMPEDYESYIDNIDDESFDDFD